MRDGAVQLHGADGRARSTTRAALTELLLAEGWAVEEMGDVLLAADELACNAVMHARTSFDVHCKVDGHVELEIADHDPHHLPVLRADDDRPGGFGLRIVERVTRQWEVKRRADSKVVRVILDRR